MRYVAAAFPSACGKTNLAMLVPTLPGWKAETIGDDICWMKFGDDGRLHAINPEYGMFGVAPGTGDDTNPNAVAALTRNTVFTNTAFTDDGDVWWEGLTDAPPEHCTDWRGNDWTPGLRHARRPPEQPVHRAAVAGAVDRAGVGRPGGRARSRRSCSAAVAPSTVPLVTEAYDWRHGVFLGSIMGSETTAAAAGAVGNLRRDPFAMLPFCGYHMGDYFAHWLEIGEATDAEKLPKLFYVNWFRKDANGKFLWPGLRREQPRARVGRSTAAATRSKQSTRRSAGCRRPSRSRPTASTSPTTRSPSCCRSTWPRGRRSCRSSRSTTRSSATACRRRSATSSPRSDERLGLTE